MFDFLKRPPDFKIRENYMHRWWVIPRNRFFNIYLHHIMGSDDKRALHDHPWYNISIVLRGQYTEILPGLLGGHKKLRKAGHVLFRKGTSRHRLVVEEGGEGAWTLFITGPKYREWGFHCPKGWVHWKIFCDPENKGLEGRGCE